MRTKIIALLFVVTAGCLSLTAQNRGGGDVDIDLLRKLQYAQLAITNLYVDSVDQNKLVEDAIVGMLEKLDPHSSYTNAQETKKLNEPLEG
ncbi:MAG: peptidase S41, partial [Alloprevotella sp.]|nr:peptidase S41 [Alloprevotella sp.]